MFQGYHGNEAGTRDTFDEDGFLKSGDVVYFEEGTKRTFILGRKKVSAQTWSHLRTQFRSHCQMTD